MGNQGLELGLAEGDEGKFSPVSFSIYFLFIYFFIFALSFISFDLFFFFSLGDPLLLLRLYKYYSERRKCKISGFELLLFGGGMGGGGLCAGQVISYFGFWFFTAAN